MREDQVVQSLVRGVVANAVEDDRRLIRRRMQALDLFLLRALTFRLFRIRQKIPYGLMN